MQNIENSYQIMSLMLLKILNYPKMTYINDSRSVKNINGEISFQAFPLT